MIGATYLLELTLEVLLVLELGPLLLLVRLGAQEALHELLGQLLLPLLLDLAEEVGWKDHLASRDGGDPCLALVSVTSRIPRCDSSVVEIGQHLVAQLTQLVVEVRRWPHWLNLSRLHLSDVLRTLLGYCKSIEVWPLSVHPDQRLQVLVRLGFVWNLETDHLRVGRLVQLHAELMPCCLRRHWVVGHQLLPFSLVAVKTALIQKRVPLRGEHVQHVVIGDFTSASQHGVVEVVLKWDAEVVVTIAELAIWRQGTPLELRRHLFKTLVELAYLA